MPKNEIMTETEKNFAEKIKHRIKELDTDAEIILYGSHATGKAENDSDWDILALLSKEHASFKTEQLFRHHLLDLEIEIGQPISIMVKSKTQWVDKYKKRHFLIVLTKLVVFCEDPECK